MKSVKLTEAQVQALIQMRRDFHSYPEASYKEFETQKRIMEQLESVGIRSKAIGDTGVLATIEGLQKYPTDYEPKMVALRADMDALELTELNDVSYKSQNQGLMHACGHDGHVAMLLSAASVLQDHRDTFVGKVRLLFQPAEEMLGGAKKLIAEGALEGVDAIYGHHLWNDIAVGQVDVKSGARMASGDPVKIIFKGKGGHGSMPNQTIDPIVMASSFIMNANAIISRESSPTDPVVFTLGKMKSGTRFNIIPEVATVEGSLRCFSQETRLKAHEQIHRYAEAVASMYGGCVTVEITCGTPPLINDHAFSDMVKMVAENLLEKDQVIAMEKTTGSEDMAYYLQELPGVFAFIGSGFRDGQVWPPHHPKFDFDEGSLKIGAEMFVNVALAYLNRQ